MTLLSSTIVGSIDFTTATVNQRLTFATPEKHEANYWENSSLTISRLIARAGAAIELSTNQLILEESEDSLITRWTKTDRIRDWLLQYLICVFRPIANYLGLTLRGRLIAGEDSDDPEELASAAADYNRLRDLFRNQPSTDKQEEICNFKYLDLTRRARWARAKKAHIESKQGLFDGWRLLGEYLACGFDWLISRNALGYLIKPWRIAITAGILIITFAFCFSALANPNSVNYFNEETGTWLWDQHPILNPLYFSVVTFTSLGYGDIQPSSADFKILAATEAVLGVILIALFVVAWARKMVR